MHLSNIQKISLFMIPVFIILFMSYQHSKVIEGAIGSKSSGTPDAVTPDAVTPDAATPDAATPDAATPDAGTSDAKTQSYINAATVDEYLKNQCTNEKLDELSKKLDDITDQMQDQNEKMEMSN